MAIPARVDAELVAIPPLVQLGEVKGGPPLTRSLTLTNRGGVAIEIVRLEPGCNCLEPASDRSVLGPGESATLTLHLRTTGHRDGPYAWFVQVRYRSGEDAKELAIRVEADIRNEVSVEPTMLALQVSGTLEQQIVLTDRRPQPLRLTGARTSLPGVTIIQGEPGGVSSRGSFPITIRVDAAKLTQERTAGSIDLYTDDALYAHLAVPVTITRLGRAEMNVTPERVRLCPRDGIRTALIRLRGAADKLPVQAVHLSDDARCTWAPSGDGGALIRVRVERALPVGAVVQIGLKDGSVVEVPVDVE